MVINRFRYFYRSWFVGVLGAHAQWWKCIPTGIVPNGHLWPLQQNHHLDDCCKIVLCSITLFMVFSVKDIICDGLQLDAQRTQSVTSGILEMIIISCFSMQEEDIHKCTRAKCYLCTLQSTCKLLWNIDVQLIPIIWHTCAKILVSTLEHQVWLGDTNDEVVDHQCT